MGDSLDQVKDPLPLWGVGEVLKMSIPTAMGMVNSTVMQFVDGLMVAQVRPFGPESLSAQFSAGWLGFVPQALMMGTLTVVNTFVAQNFGAKRYKLCGQYTWAALYLAAAWSVLMLPLAGFAPSIYGAVGHEPIVQQFEVMYFRYMMIGQFAFLGSRVLEAFFYGTQRPTIVYLVSLLANAVNAVAAFGLIFGKWGLPALGLQGAAIATVIGQCTSLVALGGFFLSGSSARLFDTRHRFRARSGLFQGLLRIGWPAGVQMCIDVLGWALAITLLVGSVHTVNGVPMEEAGTINLTASVVALRYETFAFMPTIGISIAATALAGKYIGQRQVHLVKHRVWAALLLGLTYMGLWGIAFWVWRAPLIRFYLTLEPTHISGGQMISLITQIGSRVLIVGAIFQIFDAMGIVFTGALRGAGDTLWPMAVTGIMNLVIILGGGYLMLKLFPQLESLGPWLACAAYVIILGPILAARFAAGKWRKIDLLRQEEYGI